MKFDFAQGLAKEKLQWSPKIELREGLSRTIPYFQELIS
jgi:nucleoside-diphosphate-sugar epimerase